MHPNTEFLSVYKWCAIVRYEFSAKIPLVHDPSIEIITYVRKSAKHSSLLLAISMLVSRLCYRYHATLSFTSTLSPLSSLFKHSSGIYLAAKGITHVRWRSRCYIFGLFRHNNPISFHDCEFYTREATLYLPNKNFESSPYSFYALRMRLLQTHTAVHYNIISIKSRNERTECIITI